MLARHPHAYQPASVVPGDHAEGSPDMTSRINGQNDDEVVGGAVNLDIPSPDGPKAQTVPRISTVLPPFVDKSVTKPCIHRGRGGKLTPRNPAALPGEGHMGNVRLERE